MAKISSDMRRFSVKAGDIIWQSRTPGGWCIVLEVTEWDGHGSSDKGWLETDYPIYKVVHPAEGVIQDASYYYQTQDEYCEVINRIWKDGKIIGHKKNIWRDESDELGE